MSAAVRRIALLASPGPASERLRDALASVGGDLVLDVDPSGLDIATLQDAAPQAIVVLLDPAVEDAIEAFDAVLADPAIDVLYEEADIAATREGWDAARWGRHLAAKLLHHDDVLPPVTDAAPVLAPEEAPNSADAVPASADALLLEEESTTDAQQGFVADSFDPVSAEYVPDEASLDASETFDAATQPLPEGIGAEPVVGLDEMLAAQMQPEASTNVLDQQDDGRGESGQGQEQDSRADTEQAVTANSDPMSFDAPAEGFGSGPALSPDVGEHTASTSQRVHDLDDLERRISTLELVSDDESEDAPAKSPANCGGALLILAGIGGPDAVRQLLGMLSADFPRPVLVQQRLDGGRHDRLVQQMSRATELPVHLAEIDAPAEAGHVYILPPSLGVAVGDGLLRFVEGGDNVVASLPASDSAVLLLSGSESSLVESIMAHAAEGAFVAGQSPDGCYDSAATSDLVSRGGQTGQPIELAERVQQFWASRG